MSQQHAPGGGVEDVLEPRQRVVPALRIVGLDLDDELPLLENVAHQTLRHITTVLVAVGADARENDVTEDDRIPHRVGGVEPLSIPRLTPHDLRHTAASLAISSGANVKAVQRMVGHASAAMTLDTYADRFDDDLGAVAARLNEAMPLVALPASPQTRYPRAE